MCFYAEARYKLHHVCVDCRVSFKRHPAPVPAPCPNCAGPLRAAGHDFAPPRRHDTRAWSVVVAVLAAGLRYEGREPCGCARAPKHRPRTRAQLRAFRTETARSGLPAAERTRGRRRRAGDSGR
ncbi:hypothetical protein [Streptomyces lavendulocolor]|uniref:hypothetical protein n=1 Tax=Streptomyces lavendulocolor TaxID=67316 RepID=UPI003C2D8FD0